MPFHISSSVASRGEYKRGAQHRIGRAAGTLALVWGVGVFIVGVCMAGVTAFALTAPVLENLNNASLPAWGAGAQTSIATIVGNIILAVLGLLGVIFTVLLIYGGFLWLTSAGEEDKAKKGTGLIFNAIIGALIVIAAYATTYFVLQKLVGAVSG
ncbi:MAG: hypothetical protein Q8P56_06700 [Candidatus Uhrbacteria bacterium]|nr:hypothetical protein [Candidatus Uhrbacteria bacterium]